MSDVLACVLKSEIDKVWVIDHSPDDSLRRVMPADSRIEYIKERNVGYGRGNNVAMLKSIALGYDYHLVLNPDVNWQGDVVGHLRKFMDNNPDVALAMPKVCFPDGTFQHQTRLLPRPIDLIRSRLFKGSKRLTMLKDYELLDSDQNSIINAPFLSGCFMFLRVGALRQVGVFDERFFMYHEDMDLTRRLHRKYRTVYNPEVKIFHKLERQSAKNTRLFLRHVVSMVRYFNKWGWISDPERRRINAATLASLPRKKK